MDESKMRKIAAGLFGLAVVLFVFALTLPEQTPDYSKVLDENAVRDQLPSGEDDAEIRVYGDGSVRIRREMAKNLNAELMLYGARKDSIEIFKSVFKDPRVNHVSVISTVAFVDSYGHKSTDVGATYAMYRETYQKINWDSFMTTNLDKVADQIYIHPTFR